MPILGFYLASFFTVIIMDYDHWIAFILLGYIGINMIQEGLSQSDEKMDKNIFTFRSLLFLSIATSIDALAVGISLTASTDNIYFPALIIAIITGILSFIGVRF
jgi:putative Mn2+ efflux pump MntP